MYSEHWTIALSAALTYTPYSRLPVSREIHTKAAMATTETRMMTTSPPLPDPRLQVRNEFVSRKEAEQAVVTPKPFGDDNKIENRRTISMDGNWPRQLLDDLSTW